MNGYASNKEYLKVNSIKDLMNLCQSKISRLNLFLKKNSKENA